VTTGCTHVCIVGPLPLIVVAAVSLAAQSSSEDELVGRTRSSRRQRADAAAALLEDKVACEGGAGARTKGAELIRVSPRGRRSRHAGWSVQEGGGRGRMSFHMRSLDLCSHFTANGFVSYPTRKQSQNTGPAYIRMRLPTHEAAQ
jgi:hypothetical protein